MDKFVTEKYIEIIKGIGIMYKFMLMQILAVLVLQHNGKIGSGSYIYSRRTLSKRLTLLL